MAFYEGVGILGAHHREEFDPARPYEGTGPAEGHFSVRADRIDGTASNGAPADQPVLTDDEQARLVAAAEFALDMGSAADFREQIAILQDQANTGVRQPDNTQSNS